MVLNTMCVNNDKSAIYVVTMPITRDSERSVRSYQQQAFGEVTLKN